MRFSIYNNRKIVLFLSGLFLLINVSASVSANPYGYQPYPPRAYPMPPPNYRQGYGAPRPMYPQNYQQMNQQMNPQARYMPPPQYNNGGYPPPQYIQNGYQQNRYQQNSFPPMGDFTMPQVRPQRNISRFMNHTPFNSGNNYGDGFRFFDMIPSERLDEVWDDMIAGPPDGDIPGSPMKWPDITMPGPFEVGEQTEDVMFEVPSFFDGSGYSD